MVHRLIYLDCTVFRFHRQLATRMQLHRIFPLLSFLQSCIDQCSTALDFLLVYCAYGKKLGLGVGILKEADRQTDRQADRQASKHAGR